MQYSAFTSILKVLIKTSDKDSSKEIENLLTTTLKENSIIQSSSAFSSLLSSFDATESESIRHQLAFFDNCACRIAKKPVHYDDSLLSLTEGENQPTSLIVAAISEQWPFVAKNGNATVELAVCTWIARVLGRLKQAGEDSKTLKAARDGILQTIESKQLKSTLKKALKDTDEAASKDGSSHDGVSRSEPNGQKDKAAQVDLREIFGTLPTESKTHNELHKWEKEELEIAVEQGRISDLMLCLCSEHEEIRRQAFANLNRFMAKLRVCFSCTNDGVMTNKISGVKICGMAISVYPYWRAARNCEKDWVRKLRTVDSRGMCYWLSLRAHEPNAQTLWQGQ
jgi:nucleolar pre-ribosomal-associated protein 1